MSIPARGLTLLELMIVLAVCALLVGLAAPGLGSVLKKNEGETLINAVTGLMNFARNSAVTSDRVVTLCRSADAHSCGGQWEQGMLVFADLDANGKFDGDDQLLRQTRLNASAGSLVLRSFPNRQYVQYDRNGFTRGQNGTFTWCPIDGVAAWAQQAIFTQSGRVRLAHDSNGDGIREGSDGKPLSCN